MLQITELSCRIAGRLILDKATASIPAGHKVGLVGRNGAGKSTLFKVILDQLPSEHGRIALPKLWRIGAVAQEAPGGSTTPMEFVLSADLERASLLAEADTATDPDRIAEIHTRLADIGAHTAESRAGQILAGLGFDTEAQNQPLSTYSGGWRMRVALAAVLFAEPDLLLLDEPTNYLDLEGTLWLEGHLATYPRTVLLISHDRDLLNSSVQQILHLHDGKLTLWEGNYDRFERARAEALERQAATRAKVEEQRKHMQAFVDRFKAKASKARQAQSRMKALAKLAPIAAVAEDRAWRFRFPEPQPLPSPLINLEGAAVGYVPGEPILRRLTLRMDADDRIALLGQNGNGKSTFAKLLAGRLAADGGTFRKSGKLKVGYFGQHQLDELDADGTPLSHLSELMPGVIPAKVRARLGAFGFGANLAENRVGSLSGGEKARLVFALISHGDPNLLILDEPTNHLDVDAREALIHALNEYSGAVLLVSHDRHLIEASVERLWLVQGGTVVNYDGDLEDYRRLVLSGATGGAPKVPKAKAARPADGAGDAAERAPSAVAAPVPPPAASRGNRTVLQRAARRAEETLEKLAARRSALDAQLSEPATHGDPARLAELSRQRDAVERDLISAESAWLDAQEALEQFAG
ncbi:ABC-F family ATP-binding cassette domain-containing protein [Zavarzinia sp. CC-PAN008]|uniref:ABC-F family ATP-binding cassette domain-containing protein n=1 Tax=Zavarzinia sp. CC-PAN008 TaxID=3243332 RepID=UPI003F742479